MTSYSEEQYGFGTADPDEYESPSPYDQEHREANPWPSQPLPIINATEREAPQYGSTGTYTLQLAGAAQPVQLLQRRVRRNKARILVQSFGATPGSQVASISAFGNVTNPGANTVLASAVVPNAGFYTANWSTILAGTLSTTDRSNVVLQVNGVTVATSVNGLNVGTIYQQSPVNISIPAGATVTLLIPVANAAAVYTGEFVLNPTASIGGATAAVFHNRTDPLSNPNIAPQIGVQVFAVPYSFDWESEQPLYGVGIGGLVTVSVIDETYAER
jgi:hypothetical protein